MTQNFAGQEIDLYEEDIELIDSTERRHRVVDADHEPWKWLGRRSAREHSIAQSL